MIRRSLLLCGFLAAFAAAGPAALFAQDSAAGVAPPSMPQGALLSPTLIQALDAIKARRLLGVFSFVDPSRTNVAFANVLLYDRKALKRFVKFAKKRYKAAGAITYWEKQVLLLLVGLNEQRGLPPGVERLSGGLLEAVSEMALVPGVEEDRFRSRRLSGGAR